MFLRFVVPEGLLIEVTEKMERLDTHVGSADAALEKTPEVLKAIGVNLPVDELDSMVNDLVRIVSGQSLIGE
jgi:hypothetical protein